MISLSEILHTIAQALMIPCLIILIILMAGAVWQIGDIVVEYIAERRKHKCNVPQLLRDVHAAGADGLAELIENSGLLRRQKKALLELAESRGLPKDTLTALAERLLATEEARNARTTSITDMIAKLGPMFGLLGTLIPLGPGIVALGQGDTVTLSESMNVAFDTTIAGVISAAVASVISHIRKRWYNDDMVSLETLMEAVLEEVTSDGDGGGGRHVRAGEPVGRDAGVRLRADGGGHTELERGSQQDPRGDPPAGADAGAGQRGGDGAGHPVLQQLRAEGHGVRRPGDRQIVCGDAEEQ